MGTIILRQIGHYFRWISLEMHKRWAIAIAVIYQSKLKVNNDDHTLDSKLDTTKIRIGHKPTLESQYNGTQLWSHRFEECAVEVGVLVEGFPMILNIDIKYGLICNNIFK